MLGPLQRVVLSRNGRSARRVAGPVAASRRSTQKKPHTVPLPQIARLSWPLSAQLSSPDRGKMDRRGRTRRPARTRARSTPARATRPLSPRRRSNAEVRRPRAAPGRNPDDGDGCKGEPGPGAARRADPDVALVLVGEQPAQPPGRDVQAQPVAPAAVQLDSLLGGRDQRAQIHPPELGPARAGTNRRGLVLNISLAPACFGRRNAAQGRAEIGG